MDKGDNSSAGAPMLIGASEYVAPNPDVHVSAEHIGEQIGEHHAKLTRAKKVAKTLEIVAYVSLFFDAAIAIVTLISLHLQESLAEVTTLLNYGLTIIIVIAFILFVLLVTLSRYQRIIDELILINTRLRDHFRARERAEAKAKMTRNKNHANAGI